MITRGNGYISSAAKAVTMVWEGNDVLYVQEVVTSFYKLPYYKGSILLGHTVYAYNLTLKSESRTD